VDEYVGRFFHGRIDQRSRYRRKITSPDIRPTDYEFQVETMMIPSIKDFMGGGGRVVQMDSQGMKLNVQMEVGDMIGHLNVALTRLMNQRGQRGDFRVEEEELEEIGFAKEYAVAKAGPEKGSVYTKQRDFDQWTARFGLSGHWRRGGFSHWRIQRRSMAQRDNRRLVCSSPRPGLRAVVRCSQEPRWGQTK
jgi:hypothetical protein